MVKSPTVKFYSLRASSPIWASEASLARTRERGAAFSRGSQVKKFYKDCLQKLSLFSNFVEDRRDAVLTVADGHLGFKFTAS